VTTKAKLEAELETLRAEIAELRSARAEQADPEATAGSGDAGEAGEEVSGIGEAAGEIRDDLERLVKEVGSEIEAAAERNPAIALVGVFVAGLVVGRLLSR